MPDDRLTGQLLPGAAVRVDIGGKPNGTGFFVAPGYVVTCAHVLEPLLDTSAEARPELAIVDASQKTHRVAGEPRVDRDVDLALLQLAAADTSVAVVLLDESSEVGDELFSFGFPEGKILGDPATFHVEGLTGGPAPLMKFKEGQTRPGMSGAPMLNRRTGAVCGIVKRTRDERQDLGGYGIRVSSLYSAFTDVPGLNAGAHRGDTRWLDNLTIEQRRRLQVTSGPPPSADYLEFVIEIGQLDDDWCVSAKIHPTGEELSKVVVDLNTVRTQVPRLFRAWKAQGRINDAEQARLLGRVLYTSIVPNGISSELERLVLDQKRPLHLSLCFARDMDADLVFLPWEQLHVERPNTTPTALGMAQQVTLARVLDPHPDQPLAASPQAASTLVLTPPLGPRTRERSAYERVLDDLTKLEGIVTVDSHGELTQDELEARFGRPDGGGADIVHYIGFGSYNEQEDHIALSSADPGEIEMVGGAQLAQALFIRPPRLVVLQTCTGHDTLVPADPTVLALRLLDAGVAAVIAFPYPLQPDDAVLAAQKLYEGLSAGHPARIAVQEVRRKLRRVPWSRPALFMRRPADIYLVGGPRPEHTDSRARGV